MHFLQVSLVSEIHKDHFMLEMHICLHLLKKSNAEASLVLFCEKSHCVALMSSLLTLKKFSTTPGKLGFVHVQKPNFIKYCLYITINSICPLKIYCKKIGPNMFHINL